MLANYVHCNAKYKKFCWQAFTLTNSGPVDWRIHALRGIIVIDLCIRLSSYQYYNGYKTF